MDRTNIICCYQGKINHFLNGIIIIVYQNEIILKLLMTIYQLIRNFRFLCLITESLQIKSTFNDLAIIFNHSFRIWTNGFYLIIASSGFITGSMRCKVNLQFLRVQYTICPALCTG